MIRWRVVSPLFLVALALGGPFAGRAAADPAFSLTTSPVSLNLKISAGTSSTQTLHVMNNNPKPVQISIELDQFGATGTAGQAAVSPIAAEDPSRTFVHFSPNTFTAQPGVWTPVTMSINLPKSASLGYYYAVLFKPTLPSSTTSGENTIKGSNAVLVLIDTNSGNEQHELQVESFTSEKKLYQYLPVNFDIKIHNNGNIYGSPFGNIFISKSSSFSHPLATLSVNKGQGNVLPESVRVFHASWGNGFPSYKTVTLAGQPVLKNGKPQQKLQWSFAQGSKFRFGKYYAHLALIYSNGKQDIPVDSVVSFWVIPWKLMLVALVVIGLVLFGLFTAGRSFYRRAKTVRVPVKKKAKKVKNDEVK